MQNNQSPTGSTERRNSAKGHKGHHQPFKLQYSMEHPRLGNIPKIEALQPDTGTSK